MAASTLSVTVRRPILGLLHPPHLENDERKDTSGRLSLHVGPETLSWLLITVLRRTSSPYVVLGGRKTPSLNMKRDPFRKSPEYSLRSSTHPSWKPRVRPNSLDSGERTETRRDRRKSGQAACRVDVTAHRPAWCSGVRVSQPYTHSRDAQGLNPSTGRVTQTRSITQTPHPARQTLKTRTYTSWYTDEERVSFALCPDPPPTS